VYREEWYEDAALEQARQQRELAVAGGNLQLLAVIPPSEMNRSIREGWVNDDDAWKRWANDASNNKLRVSDGVA